MRNKQIFFSIQSNPNFRLSHFPIVRFFPTEGVYPCVRFLQKNPPQDGEPTSKFCPIESNQIVQSPCCVSKFFFFSSWYVQLNGSCSDFHCNLKHIFRHTHSLLLINLIQAFTFRTNKDNCPLCKGSCQQG